MNDWAKQMNGCAAIPMGTLIPKDFDNVVVGGRCISADIKLTNAFRMMNTCMTTGEAAGLLCVIASNKKIQLNEITYNDLLPLLNENGFILQ